jgi:acetyl esterase/lipase
VPARDAATWVAGIGSQYYVAPNIAYLTANTANATLDVYWPRPTGASTPVPTVVYFHGGGWTGGEKSVAVLRLLPYLEMGWAAVNVDYRLTVAPAAVEDCRCALRWVIRNAGKYNFDVNALVMTGDSSGSHLALTTGMLPASAWLDGPCSGPGDLNVELNVAAIVNWYGVTDVVDVIEGVNRQTYAERWLAGLPDARSVARRVSPLQYVRTGLPPIFSVHGDADSVAPYSHAVRLHKALDDAKVPNQLLTIRGGGHGGFSGAESVRIYAALREFLTRHGLATRLGTEEAYVQTIGNDGSGPPVPPAGVVEQP